MGGKTHPQRKPRSILDPLESDKGIDEEVKVCRQEQGHIHTDDDLLRSNGALKDINIEGGLKQNCDSIHDEEG